jgi:hypothetical protein
MASKGLNETVHQDGATEPRKTSFFYNLALQLQGALQIVTKGVEIWFTVIACDLVYDITMFLVATREELPLGDYQSLTNEQPLGPYID